MTFDALINAVLNILPEAVFDTDNDGQIIIYTNLIQAGVDELVSMTE